MTVTNSNNFIPTLARISPVLYPILILFYIGFERSCASYYLLFLFLVTSVLNFGMKNIVFKPLYALFPGLNNTFLNTGKRPKGARLCGDSIVKTVDDAFSFGMPSGHTQITWTFTTYLLCKLFLASTSILPAIIHSSISQFISKILIAVMLVGISIYISYSRIYIEGCHTLQQVIVGGLIGVVCGYMGFVYELRVMAFVY